MGRRSRVSCSHGAGRDWRPDHVDAAYAHRRTSAAHVLQYCLDCGISAIELMNNVAESYAGAPAQGGRGPGGPGGPGRGPGRGAGGGRPQMTPEQQAAMQKAAAELKDWRLSVSM